MVNTSFSKVNASDVSTQSANKTRPKRKYKKRGTKAK